MTAPHFLGRLVARLARLWVVATIVGVSWPAPAVPLPAPVVDATAQFNRFDPGRRIQDFGLLDHTVAPLGTLQFFSSGDPLLRATADVGPLAGFATRFGSLSGFLRYSFEITGPDCTGADGCVAVDVSASGRVAGVAGEGGGFEATSRWSLRNTSEITLLGDTVSVFFDGIGGSAIDEDSFTQTHSILLHTNREYRVVMEVIARAGSGITHDTGFGEALAFIDPVFRIGAGVDPERFAFRFSEGIGNSPPQATPEPGALALAALALAALVACRRRMTPPAPIG